MIAFAIHLGNFGETKIGWILTKTVWGFLPCKTACLTDALYIYTYVYVYVYVTTKLMWS